MNKTVQKDFFALIDTSKIYKKIFVKSNESNEPLKEFNQTYLKFYRNGKVGVFYYYNSDDINSLNPKKADLGLFSYSDYQLRMKHYFDTAQGGGIIFKILPRLVNAPENES